MSATSVISPSAVRSWFPALSSDFVFLENAGGSQIPECVANAVRDYMLTSYVQLGAPYPTADRATETVARAHDYVGHMMGAGDAGTVVLGPSTTALINIIANAYGEVLGPGDEIIVADTNHEANAGPWERLEARGVKVRIWAVDPSTFELPLGALKTLLNAQTRLVAFPHVSNLLGDLLDVEAITTLVHRAGAKVFVDGVAYAPHGLMDVKRWGVDWYVYSTYKVYGPHMAALFGTHEAFAGLTGPNHFFIDRASVPLKFELGSISHEGCAGLLALHEYFKFLCGETAGLRETIRGAYMAMQTLESQLTESLIGYLGQKPGVKLIGHGFGGHRVGTISFVAATVPSPVVADHLATRQIGIRSGHMYALRLCRALGIDEKTGVVRISLLHYNTHEEIERTISALEEIL